MEDKEEAPVVEEHHEERKSRRPNIWKLLTLALLAAILVGVAYYVGSQKNNVAIAPSPTPTISSSPQTSSSPSASITPTPTKSPTKNVEAGDNIGIFLPYRIQVPEAWEVKHENTNDVLDVLEISKNGYTIRIQQAGGEGSNCNYGAPKNEPFTQNYSYYKTIIGNDFEFRRSGDAANSTGFTICDKKQQGFQFPSFYGYISYSVPNNPSQEILSEMDSILSTIVKQ